jgi:hypothetical protein
MAIELIAIPMHRYTLFVKALVGLGYFSYILFSRPGWAKIRGWAGIIFVTKSDY